MPHARRNPGPLTLSHFERTGWQDCDNAIDLDDFTDEIRWRLKPGRHGYPVTPSAVVEAVFTLWESESDLERSWIEQQDDFEGINPKDAYKAWAKGWKACAKKHVEKLIPEVREKMRQNPSSPGNRWVVVRVDRDDRDTHAVRHGGDVDRAIAEALELANADARSILEYATVSARDAGAARITKPSRWTRLTTERRRNPSAPELEQEVLEGMARALWVTSYADWVEDLPAKERRELAARDGEDWADVAPETPPTAYDAAQQLADLFYRANTVTMTQLLERAMASERKSKVSFRYAELFGHYMAMQALGHGVSWFDDHPRFVVKFPRFEAMTGDGESLDWSPRSMSNPGRRRR